MFSTITTEPSTIIPMAMASPPRDIRFADTFQYAIPINARPIEMGTEISTRSIARRFIKNRVRMITIKTKACKSARVTVATA